MTALAPAPLAPASEAPVVRAGNWQRYVLLGGGAFLVLLLIAEFTDAGELTGSGTYGSALRLAVPILLGGLGAIFCERAGIVNIGIEGMMIFGTWFGGYAAWQFGPWWGVVGGILGGALGGLLHAVATVTFGIDHIVSGVAINILAVGVARFLSVVAYDGVPGGGATQSPGFTGDIPDITVPGVASLFESIEDKDWFLVSDMAAVLRAVFDDINLLTVFALLLVPLTLLILWYTRLGLQLRSVGEHPVAAESLGVPVYTMKYIGVIVSGAFAGLAGAFLVIEQAGIYRQGQTGGRGYIALAALIFGNWRPGGVLLGALLFGYASSLELRNPTAVHSLLLFIAIMAGAFAVFEAVRRRRPTLRFWLLGGTAGVFLLWFLLTDDVPNEFISFTPHLTTLVVLAVAAQHLRPPAADGIPYRKGQSG